jgi:hypothetical protein
MIVALVGIGKPRRAESHPQRQPVVEHGGTTVLPLHGPRIPDVEIVAHAANVAIADQRGNVPRIERNPSHLVARPANGLRHAVTPRQDAPLRSVPVLRPQAIAAMLRRSIGGNR